MDQKDILIIIPAYNEEKNIPGLLDQLEQSAAASMADILIINDASADGTAHIVKERGYRMVTNIFRLGYGGAVQVGYKYAARAGYRYIIQMDADGQHDVCNIPVISRRLREQDADGKYPDIVLGARRLEGSQAFPLSAAKRAAHALFRFAIRAATGRKITDPTTGLQGLSRRAFAYYALYNNFDDRYPDANMLMQMLLLGFRVAEVPAVMHPRTAGKSIHAGWKPLWYMIRMAFSILAVLFRIKVLKIGLGEEPDCISVVKKQEEGS